MTSPARDVTTPNQMTQSSDLVLKRSSLLSTSMQSALESDATSMAAPLAALQPSERRADAEGDFTHVPSSTRSGTCHPSITPASVQLQPKLTVNEPGDKYEQEADRVADMVMRMAAPAVQRTCSCGGAGKSDCEECKKKKEAGSSRPQQLQRAALTKTAPNNKKPAEEKTKKKHEEPKKVSPTVQRAAIPAATGSKVANDRDDERKKNAIPLKPMAQVQRSALSAGSAVAPPTVQAVINSPGQPLDTATRDYFEPRFGRDLSQVRLHTDSQAAQSAADVHAKAYAVGSHIALGAGQSATGTSGRHLLAHELVHVLQQSDGVPTSLQRKSNPPASPTSAPTPANITVEETRGLGANGKKLVTVRIRGNAGDPQGRGPSVRTNYPSPSKVGLPGWDRSHLMGPGLGADDGIMYTDANTNRRRIRANERDIESERAKAKANGDEVKVDFTATGYVWGVDPEDCFKIIVLEYVTWSASYVPRVGTPRALPTKKLTAPQPTIFPPLPPKCKKSIDQEWNLNAVGGTTGSGKGTSASETVSVAVGGVSRDLILEGSGSGAPIAAQSAAVISGVRLKNYVKDKNGNETLEARIAGLETSSTSATNSDVTLEILKSREVKVRLRKGGAKAKISGLSEATFNTLEIKEGQLFGTGALKSDKPLLSKLPLGIVIEGERVAVSFPVGEKTAQKKPATYPAGIPGVTLTSASAALEIAPNFGGLADFAFVIGSPTAPVASGSIVLNADPQQGLHGKGRVDLKIPKVDKAGGEVEYADGKLTGKFELGVDELKPLGLKTAAIGVELSEAGLSFSGAASIDLPGGNEATLKAEQKNGRLQFSGSSDVKLPLPGLSSPVHLAVTYDGKTFRGSGRANPVIHGLRGELDVHYEGNEGRSKVWGDGTLAINKNKLSGEAKLSLDEKLNLGVSGEAEYRLTDNLVGKVGINYRDKKLLLAGGIRFPKPVRLFEAVEGEKEFFKQRQAIPIPGVSLPGLGGVIVEVTASFGTTYGIGPGELRDIHIDSQISPFEDDKQAKIDAGAKLHIPSHAGLYLSLEAGLGLGVAMASATGGLKARGDAGVDFSIDAETDLHYSEQKVVADAELSAKGGLSFKLALDAFVQAHLLSEEVRKEWKLLQYEWGSGMQFGVSVPIHYATGEPFQAPHAGSIKFEPPTDFDIKSLGEKLFANAAKKEEKKSKD